MGCITPYAWDVDLIRYARDDDLICYARDVDLIRYARDVGLIRYARDVGLIRRVGNLLPTKYSVQHVRNKLRTIPPYFS